MKDNKVLQVFRHTDTKYIAVVADQGILYCDE